VPASFSFEADLWLHPGVAGWTFVTLPISVADDVLDVAPVSGGFGSIRVNVRLGVTAWSTSLFPDAASGSFVLPIKRSVRIAESVDVGDPVCIELSLAD